MMPIMMAVFAFMYTSAFSIYIILSSIIGIGTTFLINFIVDLQLKKENVRNLKWFAQITQLKTVELGADSILKL